MRATALRLREQGHTYKAIGEAVGVHPRTVAYWLEVARRKGREAAIAGGPRGALPGERRSLGAAQESLIRQLLLDSLPDALQPGFALWTRETVRALIALRCGFLMPVRTVGEYLRRWGYVMPPPLTRVGRPKSEALARWLSGEYPQIERRARAEGGEIHWGDDGRAAACVGRRLSTVTNRGKLRFMPYRRGLSAAVLIRFLERLIRDTRERKVFLILGERREHHARRVQAWLAARHERIEVFFLPTPN